MAKQDMLESTNITDKEIEVLDSFLFRCWQLGWLDKYKELKGRDRYCINYVNPLHPFHDNGNINIRHNRVKTLDEAENVLTTILSFGAKIQSLYIGNVLDGKTEEWEPIPMVVDKEDWVTEEWLEEVKHKI